MDRSAYIAMTGAKQAMLAQTVLANNLANVNTTGFRADFAVAKTEPVIDGDGFPTRAYAVLEEPATDFSPGGLIETGRDLDVAVTGDGWLALEGPDGTEVYSRAGDLRVDSLGRLMTTSGLQVLGTGGPIALPPFETLEIGSDGTITIRPQGSSANEIADIDRIKLVNPELSELKKGPDGLIRHRNGDEAEQDESVGLVKGFLESSNVSAVDALTQLVSLAREYDIQIKMLKTVEESSAHSSQLLRNQ